METYTSIYTGKEIRKEMGNSTCSCLSIRQTRWLSISYYFIMVGIILGNWVARIPDVKSAHDLSDGVFGLVLMCAVGGGLLSFPFISPIVNRFGSCVGVLAGALALAILVPFIGFPITQIWVLTLGLAGLGFGWGIVDVTSNAQASLYEKETGENVMGFFHACYSGGGIIGSLVGGAFAAYGVSPFVNFGLLGLFTLPLSILCYFGLFRKDKELEILRYDDADTKSVAGSHVGIIDQESQGHTSGYETESTTAKPLGWLSNPLYPISAIMLISAMTEGSIGDWSTIFETDTLGLSSFYAALGFSIFSLMLTLGRLSSDYLRYIFPLRTIVCSSGAIGGAGLLLVALTPMLSGQSVKQGCVYLGLFVAGAGISVTYPVLTSAASRLPGIDSTQAITTATAFVYMGILVGPPLFGGLSYLFGQLMWALVVDAGIIFSVTFIGLLLPDIPNFERGESRDFAYHGTDPHDNKLNPRIAALRDHRVLDDDSDNDSRANVASVVQKNQSQKNLRVSSLYSPLID